jgi:hypothetical protein
VLPHVNELRDKEDKVSHMSFRFNRMDHPIAGLHIDSEPASPPQGHPRVPGWTLGSVTVTGKMGTTSGNLYFSGDSFGCFATGSSKVKRGV